MAAYKWHLLSRGRAAIVASVLFVPTAGLYAAQAVGSFHSGMYEGLMLAVAQSGEISGYYREAQGEGVTKTCSFFLSGRATSEQVNVKTWNTESFPGMLKSGANQVTLRIEKGREHPGCGLVLMPEISQGITLDLTVAANWTTLRRITSPRAYFYQTANGEQRSNTYVVKGDVVGVLSESPGWLQVEYIRGGSRRTRGWIRSSDCESLVRSDP